MSWLMLVQFGVSRKTALLAGSFVWLTIFGVFWLGLFNIYLATRPIMSIALPLAWVEVVVAACIVRWSVVRK